MPVIDLKWGHQWREGPPKDWQLVLGIHSHVNEVEDALGKAHIILSLLVGKKMDI